MLRNKTELLESEGYFSSAEQFRQISTNDLRFKTDCLTFVISGVANGEIYRVR